MATAYKVIGQSAPANTSNADLYTVPTATETVISSLVIANVTGSSANARVFVRPNAATAGLGNAIVYDITITANSTVALTLGITVDAGDVITVRSSVASALTFHAFGSEITE
jgi:hypothetical protein